MIKDVLSYGLGTLTALVVAALLVFVFIRDITQKKHSVLRNYPIVGRLRYFFEQLGEYFRQYFFAGDRDEMPFNRATRGWVYRLAKNEGGTIGFGSTYDLHQPGALIFVNHPFPVLEEERQPTPTLILGEGYCKQPFEAKSIVNISGMSFGAISAPAVRSLSRGAAVAGCWMDTGYGVRTARGFMFSLGCIQALRCHQNTCPTGVTTHNKRLQRALVVEEKYLRVANYAN